MYKNSFYFALVYGASPELMGWFPKLLREKE